MSIGDTERTTQNRVIDFFKNRNILDYKYRLFCKCWGSKIHL